MLKQENPGTPRSSIQELAKKMARKALGTSGEKYLENDKKVMARNRRLTGKPNANVRNYRRYLNTQDQGLYADLPKARQSSEERRITNTKRS